MATCICRTNGFCFYFVNMSFFACQNKLKNTYFAHRDEYMKNVYVFTHSSHFYFHALPMDKANTVDLLSESQVLSN